MSRLDSNNNNNNELLFVFIFDNCYDICLLNHHHHHHCIVDTFDLLFTYVPYLDNVLLFFSYSYTALIHIDNEGLLPILCI